MKRFLLAALLPLLLSACGLQAFLREQDYGFVISTTGGATPDYELRKFRIIRDREASPVRFEGVIEGVFFDDVSAVAYQSARLGVRDDGRQVYVAFRRFGSGLVRVLDNADGRTILSYRAGEVVRDATLICDLASVLSAELPAWLATRGIDTAQPYDVSFRALGIESSTVRRFEPLGWTASDAFTIEITADLGITVTQDGVARPEVLYPLDDLYVSYDLPTLRPTCETARPAIKAERRAYADSTILNEPGRVQQLIVAGQRVFTYPADATARPRPLRVPGQQAEFFGPFN